MLEYPKTLGDLLKRFPDERACRDYLQKLHWPDSIQCPRCSSSQLWVRSNRPVLECGQCDHQVSI